MRELHFGAHDKMPTLDVLLVDDSSTHRMLVKRSLIDDDLDARFKEASLVREAVEVLRSGSFDCALVDYRLPDGDAFEILREIGSLHPGITVFVLTAMRDDQLGERLRAAGAQECLDKSELFGGGLASSILSAVERCRRRRDEP